MTTRTDNIAEQHVLSALQEIDQRFPHAQYWTNQVRYRAADMAYSADRWEREVRTLARTVLQAGVSLPQDLCDRLQWYASMGQP